MATKVKRSLIYIALILLAVICLLPFALMMINATRTGPEIVKSFTLVPGVALRDNWETVSGYFDLFRGMLNSVSVALPSTLLTSYFSALAAYALVMYAFKGNKVISTTIVIFMMIPGQLSLIGFYDLITNLGMIDTYWPLILPAVASPGVVFFLRQYLEGSLQPALVEAARIDGATEIHIFHKIILPLMSPGIATMAIGAFVGSWNNYLIPLILLNSPDKFTLPVMIASLNSSQDITRNQGAIYLAVAISVIPILIAFAFLSKYIIGSISAGGVKE
ncbi:carbohydrate ABC transporter permease [Blautia liquoris]|uniref:Carbohydrate ABC transporter permease n=1 Tax=Blautia liquoris TaxID=2779518 RepID=A0A7M2RG76_9FIRM|nr:carbohydrate ABC transporter permease [Blautia liquoris]QOV18330.1 carbohydrate ABC transporter permease [Blautia liquoris]